MEDNILLYIVILVIGLLSQLLKKKKPEPEEPGHRESDAPAKTFEDLLREFTQERSPERQPSRREMYDEIDSLEDDYEDEIPNDEEIEEIYKRSIYQGEPEKPKVAESDRPLFGHFKEFEKKNETSQLAEEIKSELSSPESAAKAIIYSEILNRKY